MTTQNITPTRLRKRDSLASLPLWLAIAASVIQVISLLRLPTDVMPFLSGVRFVGIAASIAAIISGHIVLSRIKRRASAGRGLAVFGLLVAYLSLLVVPVLLYGLLFMSVGGH